MNVHKRNDARPARVRLSVKDNWPVAVITAGLILTAIWTVMIGWAAMEILTLIF